MLRKHNLIMFYPFLDIEWRLKPPASEEKLSEFRLLLLFSRWKIAILILLQFQPLSCLCKMYFVKFFFVSDFSRAFIFPEIIGKNFRINDALYISQSHQPLNESSQKTIKFNLVCKWNINFSEAFLILPCPSIIQRFLCGKSSQFQTTMHSDKQSTYTQRAWEFRAESSDSIRNDREM